MRAPNAKGGNKKYAHLESRRLAVLDTCILTSSAIQCNRIFPCVHCKNRGVQRNCHFKEKPSKPAGQPTQASGAATSRTAAGVGAGRKRFRGSSEDSSSDSDSDADADNGGLDSVGRNGVAVDSNNPGPLVPEQSSDQLVQLSTDPQVGQLVESSNLLAEENLYSRVNSPFQTRQPRPRRNKQYYLSTATCTELRTALSIIPEDRNHVGMSAVKATNLLIPSRTYATSFSFD